MGGWLSGGKVSTILTPLSAKASVLYTMPKGASPRDTSTNAARTVSARATCFSTLFQTPNVTRALLPYLPAGALSGFAIASLSAPRAAASGKFGAILSVEWLDEGA